MMKSSHTPLLRDIVLVGGGHTHALVIRMVGMRPWPGTQITLISDVAHAPYSGMLPGLIAGLYEYDDAHIDLRKLCQFAGVRFIQAKAKGLDLHRKRVELEERPPVRFDYVSLNLGSQPAKDDISGAGRFTTPAKPVPVFLERWNAILAAHRQGASPRNIAVVGGGAGGVEIALGIQRRLDGKPTVHLVHQGEEVLTGHNQRVRCIFQKLLSERGIELHLSERVNAVGPTSLRCASGLEIPAEHTFWVTHAKPLSWLAKTGLATDDAGFIRVNETLQSVSHDFIFAVGDVATIENHPRPKSGVFAVREAKPLFNNLQRAVLGRKLQRYRPQKQFLSLIGTASPVAVASRRWLAWKSPKMWRLKDWIDRRFMAKFENFPSAKSSWFQGSPPPPQEMRCSGCAAKLGPDVLHRTLMRLRDEGTILGAGPNLILGLDHADDAAVWDVPRELSLVQTVDSMPSPVTDPWLFGRIASAHSLSDLYAMGSQPHSVLAMVQLPHAADAIVEEMLYQMLSGVLEVLRHENITLLGGHSMEGDSMGLGLACNGLIPKSKLIQKRGMRSGETLILTKSLGVGVLFASEMRLRARGRWIEEALDSMVMTNATAAACLRAHGASACTDVTGFGLAGHLLEMLRPSSVVARIALDQLPILNGAAELASEGLRSSLHPANSAAEAWIHHESTSTSRHPNYPLLFDPQTSGGLLASVPSQNASACLVALHARGCLASRAIGTTLRPPEGKNRQTLIYVE